MLKREQAPLSKEVWEEIEKRAKDVLNTYLSARKVVNVNGPKGWDYTVVEEGRLDKVKKYKEVDYGTYKVKPLIEPRVEFELDRWELDNFERGAKDIDLEPLEEAVKKIALFEDDVIYNGLEKGNINGLNNDVKQEVLSFGNTTESIMDAITTGIIKLKEAYAKKPYSLVVGEKVYKLLNKEVNGYPLLKRVVDIIGSKIVYSHVLEGALLLPFNHEDLEMTIGQDLSIGYQTDDQKKIRLFITESFTFRTLDENIIIKFTAE